MGAHTTLGLKEFSGGQDRFWLAIRPYRQEDMEAHDHVFFELAYVTSGTALHTLNGAEAELHLGDYFIIDYGSVHSYSHSKDFSLINCLFLPEAADETLKGCQSFEELMHSCLIRYYKLALGKPFANRTFHDDSGVIRKLLDEMMEEYEGGQTGYTEIIRNHLQEILIRILRSLLEEQPVKAKSSPVLEMVNYIHSHYMEPRVLGGFCDVFHFNPQYISRCFRRETGYTMSEYVRKVRIEKSCELLAGTELRVAEIAQAVGYGDVKSFETVFGRMIHLSPREYRKRLNNE